MFALCSALFMAVWAREGGLEPGKDQRTCRNREIACSCSVVSAGQRPHVRFGSPLPFPVPNLLFQFPDVSPPSLRLLVAVDNRRCPPHILHDQVRYRVYWEERDTWLLQQCLGNLSPLVTRAVTVPHWFSKKELSGPRAAIAKSHCLLLL